MAIQDNFIGNLRGSRNTASGLSLNTDQKTAAQDDVKYKAGDVRSLGPVYTDAPRGGEPSAPPRAQQRMLSVDGAALDAANRGTVRPIKFGPISAIQYEDFMAKKEPFAEMMGKWTMEDTPEKRIDIVNRYSRKFKFNDNPILSDMLRSLSKYDDGNINDPNAPEDAFTIVRRQDWYDAFIENLKAAQDIFNPSRRA